jgi:hypothetical protein
MKSGSRCLLRLTSTRKTGIDGSASVETTQNQTSVLWNLFCQLSGVVMNNTMLVTDTSLGRSDQGTRF